MPLLIGTDEAGYGPNLGPLVIAASAWRLSEEHVAADLYDLLDDVVCRHAADSQGRLAIADSKQLYKPRGSLSGLELGVHSALSALQRVPTTWRKAFEELTAGIVEPLGESPWYKDFDEPIPADVSAAAILARTAALRNACQTQSIELVDLRARVIFPVEFNRRVRRLGSKGSVLTEETLRLVEGLLASHVEESVYVQCDKHGGRNRYAAALQHVWPDGRIIIAAESRAASEYLLTIGQGEASFRFAVGGESQLPSALASMTAKYLRELAMRAFNAYWQQQVDNLRPTAGYPVDARRFKADIAAAQRRLQIDDDDLWRCK